MAVFGYARISTQQQSIDRQIRNIRQAFPEAVIVQEAYTGTKLDRPEWNKLYAKVRAGDTVVFDSVSRMSRDALEGVEVYQVLYERGVELVFLKEQYINTGTYRAALKNSVPMTGTAVDLILSGVNAYLLELAREQIRLAFAQAEKEISDLHQRTREGIQTARLAGRQIGQRPGAKLTTKKSIAAKALIEKHSRDFGGSLNDAECMKLTGVARNTFYRYKKELRAGQKN